MTRNWYEKPSVAVDLDGTLCADHRREWPGVPRPAMVRLLNQWWQRGYWIVLWTSRPLPQAEVVQRWIDEHGLPINQVVLGAKPNADVLIDDKGLLPPLHALDELVELRVHETPAALQWTGGEPVTEFRRDMENCGENPAYTGDSADGCRVVVPLTGGLDSATAYAMAVECGYPVATAYVDAGQEYARDEIAVARAIDPAVTVLPLAVGEWRRYEHILVGRNAAFTLTVADWHRSTLGGYGELWLGNHGDETKLRAGDKSIRFHATMQHLLTAQGYDLHLTHPLQGLTKTDLVRWWAARGRLPEALATRTCFTGTGGSGHCGSCWACLQRVLAFGAAGYLDEVLAAMPGVDFAAAAARFWEKDTARRAAGQRSGRDPGVYWVMAALGYPDDATLGTAPAAHDGGRRT